MNSRCREHYDLCVRNISSLKFNFKHELFDENRPYAKAVAYHTDYSSQYALCTV